MWPAFICVDFSNQQLVTKNINQWHIAFGHTLATKLLTYPRKRLVSEAMLFFSPCSSETISFQTKQFCAKRRNKPSVSNATCQKDLTDTDCRGYGFSPQISSLTYSANLAYQWGIKNCRVYSKRFDLVGENFVFRAFWQHLRLHFPLIYDPVCVPLLKPCLFLFCHS